MTTTKPVPAQSLDGAMIASSRRQHVNTADKLFGRIINCAQAGRQQLANGQPPGPAARQIGMDLMELMAELGELREATRFAGWTRQPAA